MLFLIEFYHKKYHGDFFVPEKTSKLVEANNFEEGCQKISQKFSVIRSADIGESFDDGSPIFKDITIR